MHVQTHVLSGWCLANLFPLSPRQRLGAMIAASAADLDGLGIVFGQEAYWRYHHTLGHNLLFGLVLSLILAMIAGRRVGVLFLYLNLFHLHLLMDFFGSGPGWPIAYLWPFSRQVWDNRHWSWAFYSWENISTAAVFVAWTVLIVRRKGRTPLEALMPNLDRQLVRIFRRRDQSERPVAHSTESASPAIFPTTPETTN
jgi:inner membrane protein